MLKLITKISVFVCLLSAINPVTAGRVDTLYDVEILVADESTGTREQAFKQGLDEVFIRISGDSTVMGKLKRPPASRYVKQFSYEPVEKQAETTDERAVTGENNEILTHRLKIIYNGRAMEKYLLDNSLPVWGEYRPEVVVWLNVRDGRNDYVLKDDDQSLIKTSLTDAMARRGIPVQWPAYDQKDKKILTISDIKGGFKDPVIKASRRYSRGPALTGSMTWNGKQWRSSWDLLMEDENKHWSLSDTDHNKLINQSIDQVANALGAIFAVHTVDNKQPLAHVWLYLQSVNTVDDYRYVENYLADLSAVENVKPAKVDGQNAVFEVVLRSNEEDFLNLIKNDAELTELDESEIRILKKQSGITQAETGQSGSAQTGMTLAQKTQGSDASNQDAVLAAPAQTPAWTPAQTQSSLLTSTDNEKNAASGAVTGQGADKGNAANANAEQEISTKQDETESAKIVPTKTEQAMTKHTYYYRLNRSR